LFRKILKQPRQSRFIIQSFYALIASYSLHCITDCQTEVKQRWLSGRQAVHSNSIDCIYLMRQWSEQKSIIRTNGVYWWKNTNKSVECVRIRSK